MGGAGPGGGGNAQPEPKDTCARPGGGGNQQMLGARAPGELAWPHTTTFVHPLSVPKPLAPNHRARKGPARSSKDSDQESLEAE